MKKIFKILMIVAIITAIFIYYNKEVIFQKGNPIPYLSASTKLSKDKLYVRVGKDEVISLRENIDETIEYFEKQTNLKCIDQMGSGYIFSDGKERYYTENEIYLRYFYVWNISGERGIANRMSE